MSFLFECRICSLAEGEGCERTRTGTLSATLYYFSSHTEKLRQSISLCRHSPTTCRCHIPSLCARSSVDYAGRVGERARHVALLCLARRNNVRLLSGIFFGIAPLINAFTFKYLCFCLGFCNCIYFKHKMRKVVTLYI